MKLSVFEVATVALVFSLALGLSACGQKKDDSSSRGVSVNNAPVNPLGYTEAGVYVTSRGNQGTAYNFSQNVVDMLSAKSNPDGVGEIADDSVILAGYLEMAANGTLNLSPTKIRIWVYDNLAKEQYKFDDGTIAQPFYIDMTGKAVSGSYTASTITATFRDEYRELTINATYSGDTASGSISFRNLKDFNGGTLKSASPMGYFVTNTCSLINCRKQ